MAWWNGPIWQKFYWSWNNEAAHSGVDVGLPVGTPYTALLPGTVTVASWEPWGYQTSYVSDIPGYGPITITGLHGSALNSYVGEKVKPGDVLMKTGHPPAVYNADGSLKYGSGDHVHFEANTGVLAPYVQYNNHQATQANHPIDPTFLLIAAAATGGIDSAFSNLAGPGGINYKTGGAAVSGPSLTAGASSKDASSCVHSISLPAGINMCLDPGEDLLFRMGISIVGLIFIIMGVLVFAGGNPSVQDALQQGKKMAGNIAKVAAFA